MGIFILSPWDWRTIIVIIVLSPVTIVRDDQIVARSSTNKGNLGLSNCVQSHLRVF